jgi:hypothetical protein
VAVLSRRWIGAAAAVAIAALLFLAWMHFDDGVSEHRLDGASLLALPRDRSGEERLLKHLGSLLPADFDSGSWRGLNDAQRAVLATLTSEWTVASVGAAQFKRMQADDPGLPTADELAEAYRLFGCTAATQAKAISALRWTFIEEHAEQLLTR